MIEQILDDYEGEYITAGLSPSEIERKLKKHKTLLEIVYAVSPVLKLGNISHIIRYDAEYVSRNITVPVFAVYAENDDLVPPEKNIQLLRQGLEAAGNTNYQIHTIPGANHVFKPAAFGTPREALQDVETSPEFLHVMQQFIEWEQKLHGSYAK